MLHLPVDYRGTAITPFTLQPSPNKETSLQLMEDINLKINGSTWALFAVSLERHPTTERKLSACSAPKAFLLPRSYSRLPGGRGQA